MPRGHVAFTLDQSYGHIVPTLGIALELMRRGHYVSYAVSKKFAAGVKKTGAESAVYDDSVLMGKWFPRLQQINDHQGSDRDIIGEGVWKEFEQEWFNFVLPELREIYRGNKPDLVIYDLSVPAARLFADAYGIPRIEHSPLAIEDFGRKNVLGRTYDEKIVMISMPRMFQRGADVLDDRFSFTGFCADGRELFFDRWTGKCSGEDTILVAGQSDGITQLQYFDVIVRALREFSGRVILSLASTDISSLGPLPRNFEINPRCSNFSILKQCDLYIGQGGQGSTLEALYSGVPVILIPPNGCDHTFIGRVIELGLGFRLEPSEALPETVRSLALLLLKDGDVRRRVKAVSENMQAENGSECAADFIEEFMGRFK